jgi:predicted DNA-binding transcriptional regulator AlpA
MTGRHDHQARNRNVGTEPRARRGRLTHSEGNPTRPGHPAGAPSSLLTIAQVLAELQVARSTFDTWRALGTAPECIKLPNGQIRVRRCALDSWLVSHSDTEAS